MEKPRLRSAPLWLQIAVGAVVAAGGAVTAYSLVPAADLAIIKEVDEPNIGPGRVIDHLNQAALNQEAGGIQLQSEEREPFFTELFDHGDELFEFQFNAIDGGGAYVNPQHRYTRFPRADQKGPDDWFNHAPERATGPNSAACFDCHSAEGIADGAGKASSNVHRNPTRDGLVGNYIQRNSPAVHGAGGIQRLAEEMTVALLARRDAAPGGPGGGAADCNCRSTSRSNPPCAARRVFLNGIKPHQANPALALGEFGGIDFGSAIVSRNPGATSCKIQVFPPQGFQTKAVSDDLVVRPFQWKGSVAFVRDFVRGAMHNELGMQGVEFFDKDGVDGDHDGVTQELSVGDITALTLYIAGQPRPTTLQELDSLRSNPEVGETLDFPPLTPEENTAINNGRVLFNRIGCDTCHTQQLTIDTAIFSEPSTVPEHRDRVLPGGRLPIEVALVTPIRFDLRADHPDNKVPVAGQGANVSLLGSFKRWREQGAIVEPFSDFRRHDLGPGVAEAVDEVGTGKSVFLTETLWGLNKTAPYLHDGRAVTVTEAILWHHGEAEESRTKFAQLSTQQKKEVVAFLNNLTLYLPEGEKKVE
jgi:hypothetical protein